MVSLPLSFGVVHSCYSGIFDDTVFWFVLSIVERIRRHAFPLEWLWSIASTHFGEQCQQACSWDLSHWCVEQWEANKQGVFCLTLLPLGGFRGASLTSIDGLTLFCNNGLILTYCSLVLRCSR